jgi:hypothetical protein
MHISLSQLQKSSINYRLGRRMIGLSLVLATCSLPLVRAHAATVGASNTKSEASTDSLQRPLSVSQPIVERPVEVVIVWGFRFRGTEHDRRAASLRAGYAELIKRDECVVNVCGFVIVQDGDVWRASNVLAASESDLMTRHKNLERENSALVIVHPTGSRRQVPEF